MYSQAVNSKDINRPLEIEFFVVPRFDSEKDIHLSPRERWRSPISLNQISDKLQINTRYGDFPNDLDGKSLLDSYDIEGAIRLSVNGKCILDIDQTTYDLVSAVGRMSQISHLNLELMKIRKGEGNSKDLVWNGSDSLMHFKYSYRIPKNERNVLVFAYDSNNRRGEETLDRIEFSQIFLLELKRFFEKIITLFPEELDTYLVDLEEINFVRGCLFCEESNHQP